MNGSQVSNAMQIGRRRCFWQNNKMQPCKNCVHRNGRVEQLMAQMNTMILYLFWKITCNISSTNKCGHLLSNGRLPFDIWTKDAKSMIIFRVYNQVTTKKHLRSKSNTFKHLEIQHFRRSLHFSLIMCVAFEKLKITNSPIWDTSIWK